MYSGFSLDLFVHFHDIIKIHGSFNICTRLQCDQRVSVYIVPLDQKHMIHWWLDIVLFTSGSLNSPAAVDTDNSDDDGEEDNDSDSNTENDDQILV